MGGRGQGKKKPKFAAAPEPKKIALHGEPCIEGLPLAWRFSGADRQGPFAWEIQPDEKFREVVERLKEFENKTWGQITETGSHLIATYRLSSEARERLVEIKLDDIDALMSFRITGPNRVWCIQTGHIMRILWWDENHQVYQVEKKGT